MQADQPTVKTPQIRLSGAVHRVVSILAVRRGVSIKSLVEEKLIADEDVKQQAAAEGIKLAQPAGN